MQGGWAALCSLSSPLWVDTRSSRGTCWRTLSSFTRRSAWASTARTSLTGEVSQTEVLLSGHPRGWRGPPKAAEGRSDSGFSVHWSYSRSFEHDFKKCGACSSTCCAGFSDVPQHALILHSTSLANNKALYASRMWRKDRKHDGGVYTVSTEHRQISLDARTLKLLLDCNIVQGRKTQLSVVSKESIMLEGKWAFYCKISHIQG